LRKDKGDRSDLQFPSALTTGHAGRALSTEEKAKERRRSRGVTRCPGDHRRGRAGSGSCRGRSPPAEPSTGRRRPAPNPCRRSVDEANVAVAGQ
jgi:hypothetical protein